MTELKQLSTIDMLELRADRLVFQHQAMATLLRLIAADPDSTDHRARAAESIKKIGLSAVAESPASAQQPAQQEFDPSITGVLKRSEFFVVDIHDMETLLGKLYLDGQSVEFYDQNDESNYTFGVSKLENAPDYYQSEVVRAMGELGSKSQVSIYKLGCILDHAAQCGHIPVGRYLVVA